MTYEDRLAKVRKEFPNFQVVPKSSSLLMRILGTIMFFNKAFMTKYLTTFGYWVWVPTLWPDYADCRKESLLRHEAVHLRQQKRFGFLLFAFLYLFFPLPLGLAYFRARFEMEAYAESMRAQSEYFGVDMLKNPEVKTFYVSQFTSGAYGWMWPFPVAVGSWYDETVKKINS